MKASKMLISTLKEEPNDAQIASHKLLIKAGMMKGLVSGVYSYLPMGLRVLNKIEDVIRYHMDESGALELLSSAIQPKELWDETGRWAKYGPELFRFKDRNEREFCLGPTHEEIFTDIARSIIKSPKSLPANLYQIQTKYRDEARPRFGLMRGREFIMKDAYSFDKDEKGLDVVYDAMYEAYFNIFKDFGLNFQVVLADTGNIGGNGSHQFMALSDVGESTIVYCSKCNYAADVEKAIAIPKTLLKEDIKDLEEVSTPKVKTIEELSDFLNVDKEKLAKTIVFYNSDINELVAVMVRGDREVNEVKVCNALNTAETFLTLATDEQIKSLNSIPGYVGPVGLNIKILIDEEVAILDNMIVGANKPNAHLINVNFKKDFKATVLDLRQAQKNDKCPSCDGLFEVARGIEVGQLFKLQTKYSKSLGCTYTNEEGKNIPMVMGCYGIGVTRTMAAIIEQHHDDFGIKWPEVVAPYHVVVVPINYNDEDQRKLADDIYKQLKDQKVEVILDDRANKPGFKFKDWELIGIPYIIVCGRRSNENIVEFKIRQTNENVELTKEEAIKTILKK